MRPMPELKVVEVPIGDLVEYRNNAKIHTHENIDSIAKSIEEFGFVNPALVWHNADGEAEIVAGHGRVLAARKVGMDSMPVIFVDYLSDEKRRALTHVLNQTTLQTGFDLEILDLDMGELDFDWESFGFDDAFTRIEWDSGVGELSEESYEEPDKNLIKCPSCGHVDSKERFVKA